MRSRWAVGQGLVFLQTVPLWTAVSLRGFPWHDLRHSRHGSHSFIHCSGNVFNTLLSFNIGNYDWKILSIARSIHCWRNGGSHLLLDSSLILVREHSNLSWYFFQYWRCETSNPGSLSFFSRVWESGDRGPGVDVSLTIVHEHVHIISATFMNFFYSITEFRIKSRSFNIKE